MDSDGQRPAKALIQTSVCSRLSNGALFALKIQVRWNEVCLPLVEVGIKGRRGTWSSYVEGTTCYTHIFYAVVSE
jgi:hypothetical protein